MGGIRLPGPQPANPSNPAAIRAINKPCTAPRGSPGRGGARVGGLGCRQLLGGCARHPRNLLHLLPRRPGRPRGSLRQEDAAEGLPHGAHPQHPGVPAALWRAGCWRWLVALGHVALVPWSPRRTAGGAGGGAGRATEWAKRPSCSGFGVLMAKPRGGAKVCGRCEVWGSAGACFCSATLLVPPRFLSVPAATGGSWCAPGARDDPCLLPSPAGNRHGGMGQRCGVAASHPAPAFGGAASPCCGARGF